MVPRRALLFGCAAALILLASGVRVGDEEHSAGKPNDKKAARAGPAKAPSRGRTHQSSAPEPAVVAETKAVAPVQAEAAPAQEVAPAKPVSKVVAIDAEAGPQKYKCSKEEADWMSWSNDKKEWCCRVNQVACKTWCTSLMDGPKGWSEKKLKWCCATYKVGCKQAPFECTTDGHDDWQRQWSDKKKLWCCDNMQIGCPNQGRGNQFPTDIQPQARLDPVEAGAPLDADRRDRDAGHRGAGDDRGRVDDGGRRDDGRRDGGLDSVDNGFPAFPPMNDDLDRTDRSSDDRSRNVNHGAEDRRPAVADARDTRSHVPPPDQVDRPEPIGAYNNNQPADGARDRGIGDNSLLDEKQHDQENSLLDALSKQKDHDSNIVYVEIPDGA